MLGTWILPKFPQVGCFNFCCTYDEAESWEHRAILCCVGLRSSQFGNLPPPPSHLPPWNDLILLLSVHTQLQAINRYSMNRSNQAVFLSTFLPRTTQNRSFFSLRTRPKWLLVFLTALPSTPPTWRAWIYLIGDFEKEPTSFWVLFFLEGSTFIMSNLKIA